MKTYRVLVEYRAYLWVEVPAYAHEQACAAAPAIASEELSAAGANVIGLDVITWRRPTEPASERRASDPAPLSP